MNATTMDTARLQSRDLAVATFILRDALLAHATKPPLSSSRRSRLLSASALESKGVIHPCERLHNSPLIRRLAEMREVAGGPVLLLLLRAWLVKAGRGGVSVLDWQRHETHFCFLSLDFSLCLHYCRGKACFSSSECDIAARSNCFTGSDY